MTEAASIPRRIGRYVPERVIGTGGMATVYLARAAVTEDVSRPVALKLVHPHLRESEEASATLLEEAKLAARIRHPNVVAVHEVGEDAEGIFLVMDYVEGGTLAALRDETLPLPVAGRILLDALTGLHAAHELSDERGAPLHLVHRDFSPQNVLVGFDGVTRLTDFGIARAASRAGVTSTGVVKGKIGYLSPEQALGKTLDRRSDVWAAGVVAWELLAGKRLFEPGDDPVSTLTRIVSETPPRLSSVRPDLPALVDQAIATALTLEPSRRWPNAEEFAAALAQGLKSAGPIAERDEVGETVRALLGVPAAAPPPSKRRAPLVIALLLAAGAAIALFALLPRDPPLDSVRAALPAVKTAAAVEIAEEPAIPDAGATPSLSPARRAPAVRPARARRPSLGPNPYRKP